jgi:hypothetical protein
MQTLVALPGTGLLALGGGRNRSATEVSAARGGPHLFEMAGKNAAGPANVVDSITDETDRFGHPYQNA